MERLAILKVILKTRLSLDTFNLQPLTVNQGIQNLRRILREENFFDSTTRNG